MNTTTKIILAVTGIAVAGGIAYFLISKSKAPSVATDTITETSTKHNGLGDIVKGVVPFLA